MLLKPPVSKQTWLLWLTPVLVLAGGAIVMGLCAVPARTGLNHKHLKKQHIRTALSSKNRLCPWAIMPDSRSGSGRWIISVLWAA